MGPEALLTKKMLDRLRARRAWAVKTRGDPRQTKGLPDVLACYRGRMLGLEVKVPGHENTVTKLQQSTLDAIKEAKGIGVVVSSVQHIDRILDAIDSVKP